MKFRVIALEQLIKDITMTNQEPSQTKFKCNECDLSCESKAKLQNHMKSVHIHESIPQMDGNDTINQEVLENVEDSGEKRYRI